MKSRSRLMITVMALLCLLSAVTLADSVIKTLYIDGVRVGEVNVPNGGLEAPLDRIVIGAEGSYPGWLYNEYVGKLDDFAIYAGVFSDAQVAAHWSARGNYTAYQAAVEADNPLLWLKLDEADVNNGMVAYNSGSVEVNGVYIVQDELSLGTILFGTTDGFVAGSSGVEFNVNGRLTELGDANGVSIDVPDTEGDFCTNLNGDVTIELWANYTDLNDYPRFFQHNGSSENFEGYALVGQLNDGNSMGVRGGGVETYIDFNDDINDGQWHYIVVTYDSTYAEPNFIDTNSYEQEVAADNPVLYLRFEDEVAQDYSGHDHWVGYGGGATIVDKVGGIGKCLFLNGLTTANYAAATNNSDPPPNEGDPNYYAVFGDQYAFAPNDITFEVWYRVPFGQTPDAYAYFFQQTGPYQYPGTSIGNEWAPTGGKNEDDTIRITYGYATWYTGRSSLVNDHKWHQLVVTYDEQYQGDPNSMHVQFYQDGDLKAENTYTDPDGRAKLGPELSHIMYGARNDIGYTYNNYAGYLDECAIYEGILPAERINKHWVAWQPKSCQEAHERGAVLGWTKVDRNKDCNVDFYDFAALAADWVLCNQPGGGTGCSPNW